MTGLAVPAMVVAVTVLLSWPLGAYMYRVLGQGASGREGTILGSGTNGEQHWSAYCRSLLTFNMLIFLVVYLVLTTQGWLPLNPDGKKSLESSLALHTAISFTTNTNLQHYSGEVSLSYLSQLSLMWLQFVSAATGIAALVAVARGVGGRNTVGNFYIDAFRATVFILLPLAVVWAVFLSLSGVPMTFAGAAQATTLEGVEQTIARGPVAAFLAIKQLGTNGGGFYGPNCAHPLENPTYWSNFANSIAILLIPMASVWMFGRVSGRMRHAAAVFAVMGVLYLGMLGAAIAFESEPSPALAGLPVTGFTESGG